MTSETTLDIRPKATTAAAIRDTVSPEEWAVRVDLAACYQLTAMNGWDDGTATHISARVPGEESFLINPFGLFFEEVTASNLIKIDLEGRILSPTAYPVNAAGFVIHSAIHAARGEDAGCVMHLHTEDGVAASCLAEGLLPLNQTAMLISPHVAYHGYEGVAVDMDERARLAADLGHRDLMILRNHGTLTVGRTVAEAFVRMTILEKACAIQMKVLAAGRPIQVVDDGAQQRTSDFVALVGGLIATQSWGAWRRRLDRTGADYAN